MADPNNWLGINLGDILAQTEQIKNAQQTRQYNALKIQQAQQDRADEQAKRDAYRQLFAPTSDGSSAPGGYNPEGLSALGAVDPEAAFKVREHLSKLSADQRELEGKKYSAIAPLVLKAQKMPYEARKGFIQSAAGYLQAQGWSPEEIASFDPTDQNIQALGAAVMTVPQVLDSMKTDWKQIGGNRGGLAAFDYMGNPVGSGNPYAGAAVNPQAAPSGVFDSLVQQESGGVPRPGPMTPYGQAQGVTQMLPATAQGTAQKLGLPWRPDLLTGKTPEAIQYQKTLGQAYFQEGLDKYGGDVRQALMYYHGGPDESLWGPKTHAYADAVLARSGAAQTGGLPTGVAPGYIPGAPDVPSAPSGFRWDATGSRLEAIPGGPADKTEGIVPIPGDSTKTGEAYLATVPKNLATQIKALSDGRLPLPSSFALKSPYWQQMLQMTAQYDPTFDAANAKTRAATRVAFTSGKQAQNITSFNTVLGHLDSLDKSIDQLGNSGFPLWNKVANFAAYESGDSKFQVAYKNFTASKNAVARELTRAFRMSGGNVSDIKDFEGELSAADSPDALHATVKKYVDLLASRINALGEQYNAGMGRSSDPINLLDPHARQVFQRLLGEGAGAPSQGWGKAKVVR